MEISEVAVIGGGIMGTVISEIMAKVGIKVILLEVSDKKASKAYKNILKNLDAQIDKWGITNSEKIATLSRINVTHVISDIKNADIVMETVQEDFNAKVKLLTKLDNICKPESIFTTNTSTFSISELGAKTNRPEKFIGLHFPYPNVKVKLVEIVRGIKTSDNTFQKIQVFITLLKKTSVEVFETPGYITTRGIIPFINEAMYMVMEGVATATDIDTALKLAYNLPRGPLTFADKIGLDELMFWMEHLFHELGDMKYRPCPLLRKMVRAGMLGVKSGQGFFEYNTVHEK